MTADKFADLLKARACGRRRWIARCPGHPDRNPSLSIAEAKGGAVLIHCHRGCSNETILGALGLAWHDLFSDILPSREQVAAARATRNAERVAGLRLRGAAEELHYSEKLVDSLGAELARVPDDHPSGARLTIEFHAACVEARKAEAAFDHRWRAAKGKPR